MRFSKLALFLSMAVLLVTSGCGDPDNTINGIANNLPEGTACKNSDECKTGLVCALGTCHKICTDNSECDINTQHCEDSVCIDGTSVVCGDGRKEGLEDCDDGDNKAGDGCSASCVLEQGWVCKENSSGKSICQMRCEAGRYGEKCQRKCPGFDSEICSGHGVCDDGVDGDGSCKCDGNWGGEDCSVCKDGYFGKKCDGLCPGVEKGAVCGGHGKCNDGVDGDGVCTCNNHFTAESGCTTCLNHYDIETSCSLCLTNWDAASDCAVCKPGYVGDNCQIECLGGAETPCNNKGKCQPDGSCVCDEGVAGVDCNGCEGNFTGYPACDKCVANYFNDECTGRCPGLGSENGVCNGHGICLDGRTGNGECECFNHFDKNSNCATCLPGWAGVSCNECAPGYYGPDCLPCACSEHGTCDEGKDGHGTCLCADHWQGEYCTECKPNYSGDNCQKCARGYAGPECTPCPGGADNACNGHGTCGGETSNSCSCYTGWAGIECNKCNTGYAGPECKPCPGGAANVCNGHGTCGGETSNSCNCDTGYALDANGSCTACAAGYQDANNDGTCMPTCEVAQHSCPTGAECYINSTTGQVDCKCQSDYQDEDQNGTCEPKCTPNTCNGHGNCSIANGKPKCTCTAANYTGATCNECANGYYGPSCLPCPGVAEGQGICFGRGTCTSEGKCINCSGNWSAEANCNDCKEGYFGPQCTGTCQGLGSAGGICNGQSECDDGVHGLGNCGACSGNFTTESNCTQCKTGWAMPSCTQCADGYWGPTCSNACPGGTGSAQCYGHGTCNGGTGGNGNCTSCQSGFDVGQNCADCIDGKYGQNCENTCPGGTGSAQCKGGSCIDGLNGNGSCTQCGGHWTGTACDTCADGYGGSDCNAECPGGATNQCNGHGTCSAGKNVTPTCSCTGNWAGPACNVCKGNWTGTDCNECKPGYGGPDCSLECPGGAANQCNGHGTCTAGKNVTPTCSCSGHWSGSACDVCAGNWDLAAGCEDCKPGYGGPDCSLECPGGAADPCNGRGECHDGKNVTTPTCSCNGNWAAPACATCKPGYVGSNCQTTCPGGPTNPCSGHGTCQQDGTCSCTGPGHWTGAACNACVSGYAGPSCTITCQGGPTNPCSGHGSCRQGTGGDGSCNCYTNWQGNTTCSECTGGYYGSSCSSCSCNDLQVCDSGLAGKGCYYALDRFGDVQVCPPGGQHLSFEPGYPDSINGRNIACKPTCENFDGDCYHKDETVCYYDDNMEPTCLELTEPCIVYVRTEGDDGQSGQSWEEALATVNAAFDLAYNLLKDAACKEAAIWIAGGDYTADRNILLDLGGEATIDVYGSFKGSEKSISERGENLYEQRTTILYTPSANEPLFTINTMKRLSLHDITFMGNKEPGAFADNEEGSALYIENCGISEFVAGKLEAVLMNNSSALAVISGSYFSRNINEQNDEAWGGAITNTNDSRLVVQDSSFVKNSAVTKQNIAKGGAIYSERAMRVLLTNVVFDENSAVSTEPSAARLLAGGAIYNSSGPLALYNVQLGNNYLGAPVEKGVCYDVENCGTALCLVDSEGIVSGSTIYGNSSPYNKSSAIAGLESESQLTLVDSLMGLNMLCDESFSNISDSIYNSAFDGQKSFFDDDVAANDLMNASMNRIGSYSVHIPADRLHIIYELGTSQDDPFIDPDERHLYFDLIYNLRGDQSVAGAINSRNYHF